MKKNVHLAMVPVFGVALLLGSSLAASPGHGYVSFSPAAFAPAYGGFTDYGASEASLSHLSTDPMVYLAPLNLPQGATVTKLTLYYNDGLEPGDATLNLWRNTPGTGHVTMANVSTSGYAGYTYFWSDEIIDYAVIDNSQYTYSLWWDVPGNVGADTIELLGVFIEYSYSTSLPAVLRNFSSGLRGR